MNSTQSSDFDWIWGLSSEQILTAASTFFVVATVALFVSATIRLIVRGDFFYRLRRINSALGEFTASLVGFNVSYSPDRQFQDAERLIDRLEKQAASPTVLSQQTEQKIVSLFEDAIGAGLNEEIKLALSSLVEGHVHEELRLRALQSLTETQTRLNQASRTASIRGFFNLAIGIGFAVAALVILKSAVELFPPSELLRISLSQAIYIMGVRVSLALVITLIAYFFLSLYKKSLEDVKYYQNEMTVIGVSATSVSLAYDCTTESIRGAVAEALLRRDGTPPMSTQSADHTGLVPRLIDKLIDKLPVSG